MLPEDEVWYQQGDQTEFEDGYSVWKGRDCPDKIALTDTEGTAQAICNYNTLRVAAAAALQYFDTGRPLPDQATSAERLHRADVKGMLRNALAAVRHGD